MPQASTPQKRAPVAATTHRRSASTTLAILVLLSLCSTAACNTTGPVEPDFGKPNPGDLKVLFIGSSYLDVNYLPAIFRGMAEAAGKQVFVAGRIQSGFYLDFFAQDGTTAKAIQDQEWDYVLLSGGCQTAGYPDTHHLIKDNWGRHDPFPALEELKTLITR